jgi:hypothetical protein
MSVNGEPFSMHGHCHHKAKCPIGEFEELIKDISYYGDEDRFNEHCHGTSATDSTESFRKWAQTATEEEIEAFDNEIPTEE